MKKKPKKKRKKKKNSTKRSTLTSLLSRGTRSGLTMPRIWTTTSDFLVSLS
jgi:hypothetical protein